MLQGTGVARKLSRTSVDNPNKELAPNAKCDDTEVKSFTISEEEDSPANDAVRDDLISGVIKQPTRPLHT